MQKNNKKTSIHRTAPLPFVDQNPLNGYFDKQQYPDEMSHDIRT